MTVPGWASWSPRGAEAPWTVGIEEEVMLLEPRGMALASRVDDVLGMLSPELAGRATAETHGSALELATHPSPDVAGAATELAALRAALSRDLARLGLVAAVAGTHPFAVWQEIQVSRGARYQTIYDTMRELARREPTFALHVHVALPDGEAAVRALNGLRAHLPVLLALSANSPFWQGRLTGLASARIPVFGAFPRVGIPRAYRDYADYASAVDVLLRCGAFPEPTFLWWDARLQPALGTLEVRVMDAQTRVADTAALAALVQCLVRLEATEGWAPASLVHASEVLDENRFLAARDGAAAALIDPARTCRRPIREWLGDLLEACEPHAAELGCQAELALVPALAEEGGHERQRAVAAVPQGEPVGAGLGDLVRVLHAEFAQASAVAPAR